MGDIIKEVRVCLAGFGNTKLDGEVFLLKFIDTATKVSTLKEQLERGITTHYLDPAAQGSPVTLCPAVRQNLVYKRDIMYDEDALSHYNFRARLGEKYAKPGNSCPSPRANNDNPFRS